MTESISRAYRRLIDALALGKEGRKKENGEKKDREKGKKKKSECAKIQLRPAVIELSHVSYPDG